MKIKPNESQIKNLNIVRDMPNVDISVEGLSKRTNKQIDEGFNKVPTSDKFITTREKPRGIASYPLLLLDSIVTENMIGLVKRRLEDLYDENVSSMTVLYKSGTKAIALCTTSGVPEVGEFLKDYCIGYTYYISKGNKQELNFSKNFDFKNLSEDIIDDRDSYISLKDLNKPDEIEDKELELALIKANRHLDRILESSTNKTGDLRENYFKELGLTSDLEESKSEKEVLPTSEIIPPQNLNPTIIPTDNNEESGLSEEHKPNEIKKEGIIKSFGQ